MKWDTKYMSIVGKLYTFITVVRYGLKVLIIEDDFVVLLVLFIE